MWRVCGAIALAFLLAYSQRDTSPALAQGPAALTGGGVDPSLTLKGQLEMGLKARRPVEFKYIAQIVKLVEEDKLPRSMVDSTFLYARQKKTRQIQYFQFALDARARAAGIVVPSLSNQVVNLR